VRVDNRASVAHIAVTPAVWKAAGLCIVVFAVLVAAADVPGCSSLSSQCLPTPLMPCCCRSACRRRWCRVSRTPGLFCDNSLQPQSV